ncbi:hypothetical protein [Candidatus Leptofilum sp.]|uniref:hypothetical protein n=1 Tax=Candidatus Leptofilum sp. TaxID=3241576 RepID=UPI003B596802
MLTTRRLFTYLLAIALFVMSVRETLDPDMWWHLRTGEAIWQMQTIPQFDLFSYTVPQNVWIVQQWLTDLGMWLVYELAGLAGLSLLFAAIVAVAFMLVYARCAGRPYLAALITLVAYFTAALPLGVRPQMINILFLALFVYVVDGVRQSGWRSWTLWLLPLVTALWANMHSGYLTGVALLGAYVVGEAFQRRLAQPDETTLTWSQIGQLAGVTVFSLLAALVNPRGIDLVLFPLGTLGSDVIQSNIVEWYSPDFHLVYFWFFGLMMALGVVSMVYSRRPVTWTDLLLFGGPAAGGLLSARHIPLFAVAAAPIIARHLLSVLSETRLYPLASGTSKQTAPTRFLQMLNGLVLLLMLLVGAIWLQTRLAGNEAALERTFPVAAVDFIEEAGLADGRIYNTYEWGGYLIWRRIPVFIDGRTELYGNEFFSYYLQTTRVRENWQQPLDEMAVDLVLLRRSSALATVLQVSTDWQEVYSDHLARVFIRHNE